jgi:SpoVK/Ycf46/Vps4 family AAA+-type ATPase
MVDEVIYVSLPNTGERKAIWEIHLGLVDQLENVGDISDLVKATEGYSGAEIESIVQDALYQDFDPGAPVILTLDKLMKAAKETVPLSSARADDLRALKVWASANARSASEPDPGQNQDTASKMGFVSVPAEA